MPMQIDTRKPDPTDDRSAFIGSVLVCLLVLAGLVVADKLLWPQSSPHHLTQQTAPTRANPPYAPLATDQWIGRAVHSSDGKYLGEVAALNEDDQQEFYVDMGDYLAIGETRVSISSDEIQEVHEDRIVLRLNEPEARNLPVAEGNRGEEL